MMNSEFKNKNKYKYEILPAFWSLFSNKKKNQHPLELWKSKTTKKTTTQPTTTPDLKELNKQIFFSLTSLHMYRKESLLTDSSTAYLNTVHPTKLRVNLNEAPSTKKNKKTKQKNKQTKKNKNKQKNKNKKSGLRF